MKTKFAFHASVALIVIAFPANAQDSPLQPPESVRDVVNCRGTVDAAERLACYDAKVDRLAEALDSQDVVVTSRSEIREARRGLFGLSMPKLNLFSKDDKEPEVDSIDAAATRVMRDGAGRLVFDLENAGRWRQIDNEEVRNFRTGGSVTIRKAAMGSFLAKMGVGSTFRVRRVNE